MLNSQLNSTLNYCRTARKNSEQLVVQTGWITWNRLVMTPCCPGVHVLASDRVVVYSSALVPIFA